LKFLDCWKTVLCDEAAAGADGGGGAAAPPVDNTAAMAALQAQIDALKAESTAKDAQIAEKDQAARYWHEEAKKKPAAKADTPIETETEEDPLEVLSKKGVKGFKELAEKLGFVSGESVDSRIESRARQLTEDAALAKEYPELADEKSEFFKSTAKHFQTLTAAGVPKGVATRQAANNAYLEGVRSGKIVTKAEQDEREERAAAAGGDKSKGKGKTTSDDENDELSDFQKSICREMGVDEKAYKDRAKKGIVYTGGNQV
jgi:hypothetical protein